MDKALQMCCLSMLAVFPGLQEQLGPSDSISPVLQLEWKNSREIQSPLPIPRNLMLTCCLIVVVIFGILI